jgi:hypothetical protein
LADPLSGLPPEEEEEPDAAHLERFGDDPPHYCATCLFRKPEDVEARMVYHAERVRAGCEVHDLLSHSEDVNVGAVSHDENYYEHMFCERTAP